MAYLFLASDFQTKNRCGDHALSLVSHSRDTDNVEVILLGRNTQASLNKDAQQKKKSARHRHGCVEAPHQKLSAILFHNCGDIVHPRKIMKQENHVRQGMIAVNSPPAKNEIKLNEEDHEHLADNLHTLLQTPLQGK